MYSVQLNREITSQRCRIRHIISASAVILYVFQGVSSPKNIPEGSTQMLVEHRWLLSSESSFCLPAHQRCHEWIRNDVRQLSIRCSMCGATEEPSKAETRYLCSFILSVRAAQAPDLYHILCNQHYEQKGSFAFLSRACSGEQIPTPGKVQIWAILVQGRTFCCKYKCVYQINRAKNNIAYYGLKYLLTKWFIWNSGDIQYILNQVFQQHGLVIYSVYLVENIFFAHCPHVLREWERKWMFLHLRGEFRSTH